MTTGDSVFTGSIPALYDRHLGPMLFAPYAHDLAHRLVDMKAGSVLETAAGTGIVTQALAASLPSSVALVATDFNQAMIDFAAAKPGLERVSFRQADATKLPFGDASFDAVVCQFGVMFFPDRVAGYREARRVLKPGGRFVCLEFSKPTGMALRAAYDAWSFKAIPQIGEWVAGDRESYQYLVESIRRFPDQKTFAGMMEKAGFARVSYSNFTGGVAALHAGRVL